MNELVMDIDCLDDFMDVIEKDLKIESILDDLDLDLELEASCTDFNISAIPKSLYEQISYVHKVSSTCRLEQGFLAHSVMHL